MSSSSVGVHSDVKNSSSDAGQSALRLEATGASSVHGVPSNSIQHQTSSQRQCWVCFATEEDDPDTEWVKPCRCRGSTMWVHQKCLQRWVDEKQRGNTFAAVACGSCGFVYTIIYPPANFVILILEKIDRAITKICPLMTGGLIIVSLYWTAVTYGAVTVMQLMGSEKGIQTLERADPVVVLVVLPTIPIILITVKMIRWEDKIVEWLRDRYMNRGNEGRRLVVPIGEPLDGRAGGAVNDPAAVAQQQILRDAVSVTRVLCGALALPTVAVTVGKLVFGDSLPHLKRAFYGGAIFLAVRGVSKIYFKYQQIRRQKDRIIIDYQPSADRENQGVNVENQIHVADAVDVQP